MCLEGCTLSLLLCCLLCLSSYYDVLQRHWHYLYFTEKGIEAEDGCNLRNSHRNYSNAQLEVTVSYFSENPLNQRHKLVGGAEQQTVYPAVYPLL